MWNLLRPLIKPMSPASAGGVLTSGPPGKSSDFFTNLFVAFDIVDHSLRETPHPLDLWVSTLLGSFCTSRVSLLFLPSAPLALPASLLLLFLLFWITSFYVIECLFLFIDEILHLFLQSRSFYCASGIELITCSVSRLR